MAATAVVFLHVCDEAGALTGTPGHSPYAVIDAVPLEAGVDLFFVISGFVMTWACWDSFGHPGAIRPFVYRRLLRIVPLYWLLSFATVVVASALPAAISDGLREGWGYVAASFAFIPWRRADGFTQPVLRLGWTLEYEITFYALIACTLPLRRATALAVVLAGLAALVLAGQLFAFASVLLAFWTDPIVAEFALGVLTAIAARQGWRAGWGAAAACLLAVGLACLTPDAPRELVRGMPAALLLFSALSWRRVPNGLLLLGDASYAIYLAHAFPMRATRIAFAHIPLLGTPIYIASAMAACLAVAVALHIVVERPLLRWGRQLIRA